MRADLPASLPLVCPACRHQSVEGWDVHTLELVETLAGSDGEVELGWLACTSCRARYPIVDGLPYVAADVAALLRSDVPALVEGGLSTAASSLIARALGEADPYAQLQEHLSIYLDAHWGDRAVPAVVDAFGLGPLLERVRARAAFPVERAVELGCSAGRASAELASGARIVAALDLSPGMLRRARRLLHGEPVTYARRTSGRATVAATVRAGDRATRSVHLVCGDAHDPPFVPSSFERVLALNLLDSVRVPDTLLSVLDQLCARGGELLLSCPFSRDTGAVTDEPERELLDRLRSGRGLTARYTVEEEADVEWTLRRDARCTVRYRTLYVRARKG